MQDADEERKAKEKKKRTKHFLSRSFLHLAIAPFQEDACFSLRAR